MIDFIMDILTYFKGFGTRADFYRRFFPSFLDILQTIKIRSLKLSAYVDNLTINLHTKFHCFIFHSLKDILDKIKSRQFIVDKL